MLRSAVQYAAHSGRMPSGSQSARDEKRDAGPDACHGSPSNLQAAGTKKNRGSLACVGPGLWKCSSVDLLAHRPRTWIGGGFLAQIIPMRAPTSMVKRSRIVWTTSVSKPLLRLLKFLVLFVAGVAILHKLKPFDLALF